MKPMNFNFDRNNPHVHTVSGGTILLLNPDPKDVHFEDIAHGLSNLCRFTGQTNRFYSVAQHSLLVSHLIPSRTEFGISRGEKDHAKVRLLALLHDAQEAYVGDMVSPVKSQIDGRYKQMEEDLQSAVRKKLHSDYGLGFVGWDPPEVGVADRLALEVEFFYLFPSTSSRLIPMCVRSEHTILACQDMSPTVAKAKFLAEFHRLVSMARGLGTEPVQSAPVEPPATVPSGQRTGQGFAGLLYLQVEQRLSLLEERLASLDRYLKGS